MNNKPQRAIIWSSVSSRPQASPEKVSLSEQNRLNREWCEANNCVVVDSLVVPGYSRYESDIIDLLDDYARRGITAYHQLREHWKKKDFDVLVCYHDSRFGRSSTAYNWVGENVIRSGRLIYRIQGGWITRENAPFQLALGSIAATTSVTQLVEGRKAGMKKRLKQGLLTGSIPPLSHCVVRDKLGEAIRIEVNEELRRLWDDLFTVVVREKVSWWAVEKVLYESYGHAAADGKAYREQYFYHLVHNPAFHGNNAMNIHWRKLGERVKYGLWVFDPSEQAPEGVQIEYNVLPAVYADNQMHEFQDELRRRKLMVGSARPGRTHLFTGLLICAECSHNLVYVNTKGRAYYFCATNYRRNSHRRDETCTNKQHVRVDMIRDWFDARLRLILEDDNSIQLLPEEPSPTARIEALEREIAALDEQQHGLVRLAAKLPDHAQETALQEIAATSEQMAILRSQLEAHKHQAAQMDNTRRSQRQAIEEIRKEFDEFWEKPEADINQVLHRLMANSRLAILNGNIVQAVPRPIHKRKKQSS